MIPIFSYLILRGRCRYCAEKFSVRYPLVEVLTGIMFMALFSKYGLSIHLLFYLLLTSLLICITFIDYDHQIIPDGIVLLGFAFGLAYKLTALILLNQSVEILSSITGLLVGGGLFLLIAIISNGGMGGGDIKLMGMLGFWFGWRGILLISFLSFIIGSIISIFLLGTKLKTRKDPIPFGPFIAISTFINMFFYEEIVLWYFNLLIQ